MKHKISWRKFVDSGFVKKHVMNLLPNEDGENQKCLIGEKEVDEVSELSEHGSCGSAILLRNEKRAKIMVLF